MLAKLKFWERRSSRPLPAGSAANGGAKAGASWPPVPANGQQTRPTPAPPAYHVAAIEDWMRGRIEQGEVFARWQILEEYRGICSVYCEALIPLSPLELWTELGKTHLRIRRELPTPDGRKKRQVGYDLSRPAKAKAEKPKTKKRKVGKRPVKSVTPAVAAAPAGVSRLGRMPIQPPANPATVVRLIGGRAA